MFNYAKCLLIVFTLLVSFSVKNIFAGTAWVNVPSVTNENLHQINKCNNQFLAIGTNGTIISSPDCHTWSVIPSITNFSLRSVCYANNLYVAVGDSGTVITSVDGISWSKQNPGTKNNLISVAGGMGLFFAVAEQDTNLILVSKDCVNWTSEMPDSSDSVVFKTVHYHDGNFILGGSDPNCGDWCLDDSSVGYYSSCGCYKTFMSSDGNSWTNKMLTEHTVHSITLTNNKYIALEEHPHRSHLQGALGYCIFTSGDGMTWYSSPEYGPYRSIFDFNLAVAWGDSGFVGIGYDVTLFSFDLKNWVLNKEIPVPGENYINSLIWSGEKYFGVGDSGEMAFLDFTTSAIQSSKEISKLGVPNLKVSKNSFVFQVPSATNGEMSIFDLHGKLLYKKDHTFSKHGVFYEKIPSSIVSGTYLASFKTAKQNSVLKFVVDKQ